MSVWKGRLVGLAIGFAFAYGLLWLTYLGANLMPALGTHEWSRENVKLAMFLANLLAYVLPIGVAACVVGFLLARVLRRKDWIAGFLAAMPAIFFLLTPLVGRSWFEWSLEIPKVVVILFGVIVATEKVATSN